MRSWKSFVAWPLAAAFIAPVQASSIVVNTVADQYGSDTAHCSLREAVRAANADAAFGGCTAGGGIDLIDLPDGVFLLTRAGRDEDADVTGDLDVAGDGVVVAGNGAAVSIVDGNGLDRIFHVQAGAAVLLLSNLTLRNGDPLGGSSADDVHGGAVYMDGSGAIWMTNVHVSATRAAQGGGAYVGSGGVLEMRNSAVSGNRARQGGGGIFVEGGTARLVHLGDRRTQGASAAAGQSGPRRRRRRPDLRSPDGLPRRFAAQRGRGPAQCRAAGRPVLRHRRVRRQRRFDLRRRLRLNAAVAAGT